MKQVILLFISTLTLTLYSQSKVELISSNSNLQCDFYLFKQGEAKQLDKVNDKCIVEISDTDYTGELMILSSGARYSTIVNSNKDLTINLNGENLDVFNMTMDTDNSLIKDYRQVQLQGAIQSKYKELDNISIQNIFSDKFKSAAAKEKLRINKEINSYKFDMANKNALESYNNLLDYNSSFFNRTKDISTYNLDELLPILKRLPYWFENHSELVKTVNLISSSAFKKKDISALKASVNKVLDAMDVETSLGQAYAYAFLDWFKANKLVKHQDFIYDKISSLDCKINPNLEESIGKFKTLQTGAVAPDFTFTGDAPFKTLHEVNAEYKVLVFFSSWCSHCVREMPKIETFYSKYKSKNVEIVGFSADTDLIKFNDFVKDLKWYNFSDLKGWKSSPFKLFDIIATPSLYLLDKDNVIIGKYKHIGQIESKIEELSK